MQTVYDNIYFIACKSRYFVHSVWWSSLTLSSGIFHKIIQISKALSQLTQYQQQYRYKACSAVFEYCIKQKYWTMYRSRLKAKNLLYINQLLHVLTCFMKILGTQTLFDSEPVKSQQSVSQEPATKLLKLNDFLLSSCTDNVNFFKVCWPCKIKAYGVNCCLLLLQILHYCQKSKISKKVHVL